MKPHRFARWLRRLLQNSLGLAIYFVACVQLLGQAGFVLDTGEELSLSADFDGDGREDAAVVDGPSGGVRLALGAIDGSFRWEATCSAGMAPVSSVAAGRWSGLDHDSLAFAGPYANRILWVNEPAAGAYFNPKEFPISTPVPWKVAPIDVAGPGNTALDDFVVISIPGPGSHSTWTTVRNAAGNPGTVVDEQRWSASLDQLNRISITPDAKHYLAATFTDGSRTELRAWDFSAGAPVQVARLTNAPSGARYVVGRFGPANEAMAILYAPGSLVLRIGRLDQPTSLVRNGRWPADLESSLGGVVGMRSIPTSGRSQLLVYGLARGIAAVLAFDGVDSFSVVETLTIPGGAEITGLFTHSDGRIQILTGASGKSQQFHRFSQVGNRHVLVESGALPKVNPASLGANVFQFDREPFVSGRPGLLRADRVGDWSSQFVLAGMPGILQVTGERFIDSLHGLDEPAAVNLGPAHPLADYGLVNQYHEALSLFSLSASVGNTVSEVAISPVPGSYRSGVAVGFQTSQAGHEVYYRLHPEDAFSLYLGTPVSLFTKTTVEYYGKPLLGESKSMLQRATYEFSIPPGKLDSDQDGVPDFVERQLGLNPIGGADSDQDQFTDLEEILAGTDPNKSSSRPAARPTSQTDAGMSFALRPLPLHPVTGSSTGAVGNTTVRLLGLDGNQLGFGQVPFTLAIGGAAPASALLHEVRPDDGLPFLVAATDPHFGIQGGTPGLNEGRELIRLIRLTPPEQPIVSYVYGSRGGDLAAEAAGWIDAIRLAVKAASPEVRSYSLAARDALVARLFERGMAVALKSRDITNAERLTLFPFRVSEGGRWSPSLDLWRSGAQFGSVTNPVSPLGIEELSLFYNALTVRVEEPSTPEMTALVALTEQMYLWSARSNAVEASRYPLPFDALREWIWDGTLAGAYATDLAFSPAQLALASQGVIQALGTLPSRQRVQWTLRVRVDSFSGQCATLERVDSALELVHLFDRDGGSLVFPDSFQLLPGALVRVDGYLTSAQGACDGIKVEVLSASLGSLPASVGEDANRNGLPDDWELLFFGGVSGNPLQDSDHDQVSDLDEFLGGSDPQDPASVPFVPVPDVTPPELAIVISEAGEVEVEWEGKGVLPTPLANLSYVVLSGGDLNSILTPVGKHSASASGRVALHLPPPSNTQATFYRLSLCWGDCSD